MKTISLTKGYSVIVDDADYAELSQYSWHHSAQGYAARRSGKIILMHRQILNSQPGQHTDHINRNRLDNRRSNLRICTLAQNNRNQKPTGGSSKYKGVSIHNPSKGRKAIYWRTRIRINGKSKVKLFPHTSQGEKLAALYYDKLAYEYYGEFAWLNHEHFPELYGATVNN